MQNSLENQYDELVLQLKSELNGDGFWSGRLSSSALATAVSVVALKINADNSDNQYVINGLNWLLAQTNDDGGFGDTPESNSNVSTSLLCYAAISYCGKENEAAVISLTRIESFLGKQNIELKNDRITSSILSFYGNDFTFSVPILSMLVICGVLDERACTKIPQLPFEFTLFPASWYSLFNLRVVSYAIPALIAVGIFVFKTRKHHNPVMSWIRNRAIQPSLRKLEKIVPESGGFLEAIPLTAFVSMCLISTGYGNNPVKAKGLQFLRAQQRPDGSWPIDSDLSTWVTTLAVKAFGNQMSTEFSFTQIEKLISHLKSIQYKNIHPFNLAQPGGWGWTNLSGSVPDVDDTCGAILALLDLYSGEADESESIINGCQWLTKLQNKDGGFPTFCKGWAKLPFDSSCADLTGHAVLAMTKSLGILGEKISSDLKSALNLAVARSIGYLWNAQDEEGSWFPLWFGNQYTKDQKNPVYGTAKVTIYLKDSLMCNSLGDRMKENIGLLLIRAQNYLLKMQNDDGSWGGSIGILGTIEESALAVCALAGNDTEACSLAFNWLECERQKNGLRSSPIGLYFAMLWYDEKLFPLIYSIEALRRHLKPS